MKITVKHVSDMKTLRSRGITKAPQPTWGSKRFTGNVYKLTPKRIVLRESKYRQVTVTLDRRTGIEVGGSISGYQMSKRDLNRVNSAAQKGLFKAYFRWFDSVYAMEFNDAFIMTRAVLAGWELKENLGVNFASFGTRVAKAPRGALVFDAGTKFHSRKFWLDAQEKLVGLHNF